MKVTRRRSIFICTRAIPSLHTYFELPRIHGTNTQRTPPVIDRQHMVLRTLESYARPICHDQCATTLNSSGSVPAENYQLADIYHFRGVLHDALGLVQQRQPRGDDSFLEKSHVRGRVVVGNAVDWAQADEGPQSSQQAIRQTRRADDTADVAVVAALSG